MTRLSQRKKIIIAAMLILIFAALVRHLPSTTYTIWVDNLWWYYSGVEMGRGQESSDLFSELMDVVYADKDVNDRGFQNLTIKSNHNHNYLVPSAIFKMTGEFLKQGFSFESYPQFLGMSIVASRLILYVVIFLLFWWTILLSKLPNHILVAIAITITGLAVSETIFTHVPLKTKLFIFSLRLSRFMLNIPNIIVEGMINFQVFSSGSRGILNLLGLAVFSLRAVQRYTWAYALILLMSSVHLTMTALFFAFVFATDMLLRPTTLIRNRWVASFASLFIISYALRESLFSVLNIVPILIGAGVIVTVMFLLHRLPLFAKLMNRFRTSMLRFEPFTADNLIMAVIWLVSLPLVYFMINITDDQMLINHFWGRINARSLLMLRISFFLLGSLYIINYIFKRWSLYFSEKKIELTILLTCFLILIPVGVVSLYTTTNPVPTLQEDLQILDNLLADYPCDENCNIPETGSNRLRGLTTNNRLDEHLVIYALLKYFDTGDPSDVQQLLSK